MEVDQTSPYSPLHPLRPRKLPAPLTPSHLWQIVSRGRKSFTIVFSPRFSDLCWRDASTRSPLPHLHPSLWLSFPLARNPIPAVQTFHTEAVSDTSSIFGFLDAAVVLAVVVGGIGAPAADGASEPRISPSCLPDSRMINSHFAQRTHSQSATFCKV